MRHNLSISENGIELVPMTLQLSQQYRELRNRDENRKWFLNQEMISQEMQEKWFKNYLSNDKDYMFAVIKDNIFAGGVAVYNIDEKDRSGEFGRLLIADTNSINRGLGIGTMATLLLCRIAHDELGLLRLYLNVKNDNHAAIRCYEKAGFRHNNMESEILFMDKYL